MIRSMLTAVDGSSSSLAALRVAADWAARLEARLDAVFVEEEQRFITYSVAADVGGGVVYPMPLPPDKLAAEQKKVAEERAAIEKAFGEITRGKVKEAQFRSLPGGTNAVLIQAGRAADLIVMGKRGRFDPPASRRTGPTTETLIHDALRPVLVVPEQARAQGPLLVAFDDSKGVQRVLPFALELAERLGLATAVLTVDEKAERGRRTQESLVPLLGAHRTAARFFVEKGTPADTICRAAEREQAGCIAMGAFGRHPIYELFFGSTTLAVLERAQCPVLLMA